MLFNFFANTIAKLITIQEGNDDFNASLGLEGKIQIQHIKGNKNNE